MKYLYNYKPIKISIENMEKEINDLDYYAVSNIDLGYIGSSGYKSSITDVSAINIQEKKDRLRFEIERLKNWLERIDRILKVLNEVERLIIEEKYFEGIEWWKIAYKLRYSER